MEQDIRNYLEELTTLTLQTGIISKGTLLVFEQEYTYVWDSDAKMYQFEQLTNDPNVFLEYHPELVSLISEARKEIQNIFGNVETGLEMDCDGDFQRLVLIIQVKDLSAEETLKRLDLLDEWWLEQPEGGSQKLFISSTHID